MLIIGAFAAAAGLALGLRFNVFTLLLLAFGIVLIFAVGVLSGSGLLIVTLKMLVALASVQITYLFGSLLAVHFPVRISASNRAQRRYLGDSARSTTY
jgi:hypothetical protein